MAECGIAFDDTLIDRDWYSYLEKTQVRKKIGCFKGNLQVAPTALMAL